MTTTPQNNHSRHPAWRGKKGFTALLFCLGAVSLMTSCSARLTEYEQTEPAFDLADYFNGPAVAWGMVQDYRNQVTRRFCVELDGQWQQDQGVLSEQFYFDDGDIEQRVWQLRRLAPDHYAGTATDVVGTAIGRQQGFALQWQYQLQLSIDGEVYQFDLDDWMYQLDSYRLFNRTAMKKFGLTVAEMTLFFDKQQPLRQCKAGAGDTSQGGHPDGSNAAAAGATN